MERYSGLVQDPQGQPIAGVFVDLSFSRMSWGTEPRTAVTDAQGRWSRLLPVGLAEITPKFVHENYVNTYYDRGNVMPNLESMRDGTAVVTLRPGVRVTGVVRDEAGNPVPDALVYYSLGSWTPSGYGPTADWPIEDMTSMRTGGDGSFALGCIPPGEQKLNVRKLGFAAIEVPIEAAAGMAPLNVVLETGGTIRGRVANQDGEPVPGAGLYSMDANLMGKTDDQGNFVVEHVPRGKAISLSFSAKGYYNSTMQEVVARAEPYELILYRPLVFSGRVIDGTTGRPVTEFEVSPCWQAPQRDKPSWIDTSNPDDVSSPDGQFSKEFDRVGVHFPDTTLFGVRIVAKGYYVGLSPMVRLGDKMEPSTIRLEPGESVSGVVVQPDGRPASGAQVVCTEAGRRLFVRRGQIDLQMMEDGMRYQKTGADGTFDLPGSPEPMGLLALHATGYALFSPGQHVSGGTVTLTPWASISGTVYRGGAPQAGVDISFMLEEATQNDPIRWLQQPSGRDGRFVFSNVPALPLEIGRGLWTTGRPEISHGVHVHPSPGEQVVVEISSGGCTVAGRLEFDLPESLVETFDNWRLLSVVAAPHEEPTTSYVADVEAAGEFHIYDVPPGAYDLTAGLYAPPPEGQRGEWTLVAGGEVVFEVPATAASNELLDLGTIALAPKE
ncbi:MAG TPA: carboxypeptidase-like regulatory domain-containing protein [Candidatus Bathyarchaeia archaeon]|nr:carboxypeptidase-like regulatory domain-containing protein [Candidatus Bathyarchaeia archaeon]